MTRFNQLYFLIVPLLVAIPSLGCGFLSTAAADNPIPTRTPLPTFTTVPTQESFVQLVPAEQANQATVPPDPVEVVELEPEAIGPTNTPTPAPPTATPTPDMLSVTIQQNMNVRSGPSTLYYRVASAAAGDVYEVIGRNDDGSWAKIKHPDTADGTGWVYVSEQLAKPNRPVAEVAIAQAPPPPPTATPVPPTPEPPPPAPPEPQYQFTPTGWHASENAAIVHFKGRIRDTAGNLVNGYSVLVDNWSWSVISHPSGASHHYPEKGDGEWDVVIPNETLGGGVGWWWLTVVKYECPNFAGAFNSQCTQFTRLSEDVKIQVNWPEETVINADWTCHWDCDKGLYTSGYRRGDGFHINQ